MLIIPVLLFFYANAQSGKCTAWKQDSYQVCSFNGQSMRTWTRTCLNTQDKEEVCWSENPNEIKGNCTDWISVREKCVRANSSSGLGTRWIRTCKTTDDKTDICIFGEENPNQL